MMISLAWRELEEGGLDGGWLAEPPAAPPLGMPGGEETGDGMEEQLATLSPSVPVLTTIEMGDRRNYSDPVLLGIEAGSDRVAEEDDTVWQLV